MAVTLDYHPSGSEFDSHDEKFFRFCEMKDRRSGLLKIFSKKCFLKKISMECLIWDISYGISHMSNRRKVKMNNVIDSTKQF